MLCPLGSIYIYIYIYITFHCISIYIYITFHCHPCCVHCDQYMYMLLFIVIHVVSTVINVVSTVINICICYFSLSSMLCPLGSIYIYIYIYLTFHCHPCCVHCDQYIYILLFIVIHVVNTVINVVSTGINIYIYLTCHCHQCCVHCDQYIYIYLTFHGYRCHVGFRKIVRSRKPFEIESSFLVPPACLQASRINMARCCKCSMNSCI